MKRKSLSSLTITRRHLKLWAEWCQAITIQGLDYSHQSILANLVKYGGFMPKSTAPNSYLLNRKAEAIDEIIEKLGKTDAELVQLLKLHYITEGKIKDKFQQSHLSRPTYFRRLNKAVSWIDEQLHKKAYIFH